MKLKDRIIITDEFGEPLEKNYDRNCRMVSEYLCGKTFSQLSMDYGLDRSTISYTVHRYLDAEDIKYPKPKCGRVLGTGKQAEKINKQIFKLKTQGWDNELIAGKFDINPKYVAILTKGPSKKLSTF